MASPMRETGIYEYLIYDLAEPATRNLPLVESPAPILTIIIVYFLCVYKLAPAFMENRKPYKLKKVLIAYNTFQMAYCLWMVYRFTEKIPIRTWWCNPVNTSAPESDELILGGYSYFILKIIDLMDTIFFILKKNYRQVTFLHVYHHSIMVIGSWFTVKYHPGGQSAFLPYLNTIVHVVMYGYYLLSVFDDKYKKSIWWKKHITQLQLFQFIIIIIAYTTPVYYDCGYPKVVSSCFALLNLTMFILFSNFYYKTYLVKSKST